MVANKEVHMFVDTQVRPQGEQVDAVAPARMKLSAAIRIGAKMRPQIKGAYLRHGKSCAIGAAMEGALGITEKTWSPGEHVRAMTYFGCRHLEAVIAGRNDSGESRESIAPCLESQGL